MGGFGALAALILASIDDVRAADLNAVDGGHAGIDTFTVTAADGTAEVVTIAINRPKDPTAASEATARALVKARGIANDAAGASTPTGKLIEYSGVDNSASLLPFAALSSPRPYSGIQATFMMAAAGVWIYELGNSAAQAFDLSNSLTDVFAVTTANGTQELVNNIPGGADADPGGFDKLASVSRGISDPAFAFGLPQGDTVFFGGGYGHRILGADAGENATKARITLLTQDPPIIRTIATTPATKDPRPSTRPKLSSAEMVATG